MNINIPFGIYFKSHLRILNYTVKAEVRVTLKKPRSIYMDCEMSPISWIGGLIVVQRSKTNNQEGPRLFVDIDPPSNRANVNISGKYQTL